MGYWGLSIAAVTDDIIPGFRFGFGDCAWKADAVVPPIYHKAFAAVDPTGSGDTTLNALSRVLQTSLLPAATVDKVRFLSPYNLKVDIIQLAADHQPRKQ